MRLHSVASVSKFPESYTIEHWPVALEYPLHQLSVWGEERNMSESHGSI